MKNLKRGILEIMPNKCGFIRLKRKNYKPSPKDTFVKLENIRKFNLKNGDFLFFYRKKIKNNYFLFKIKKINERKLEKELKRVNFNKLTPIHPNKQMSLSCGIKSNEIISNRIIDMISPVGFGQRGLLVSPPKSGKTIMLKNIGKAIEENYPSVKLITLLIDERPEEVTEIKKCLNCDIFSSTFDESPFRHIQLSELVLDRAKRLVEENNNVVILLDSITRLARAYNSVIPNCGKTLTGGIDSNALIRPKRFFGSARNTKSGGTLTIIGTTLVETGSKMDDVIYEEFKGTGNMEIHLERNIAYEKLFPAINVRNSGTRREELIFKKKVFKKIKILRKFLSKLDSIKSLKFLIDKIKNTYNNKCLFKTIKNEKKYTSSI